MDTGFREEIGALSGRRVPREPGQPDFDRDWWPDEPLEARRGNDSGSGAGKIERRRTEDEHHVVGRPTLCGNGQWEQQDDKNAPKR